MENNDSLAIYIHFPYCKSRCPYCDFFRELLPKNFDEKLLIERYHQNFSYLGELLGNRPVHSIFFGGGTPSLLSADAVQQILDDAARYFTICDDAEISLEANPNTFDRDKFVGFHKAGINRLSLGVQALNEAGLRFLGRTHTLGDAKRAMELGMQTFEKFSIDLIYARPEQTWRNWKAELDCALSFGLKHISLYQLSIEEGTTFARKKIEPMSDEDAIALYDNTISYLRERGFERYEVSNFAKDENNQSVHNLVYWQGGDYIGIGEGAHGRFIHQGKIYASTNGKQLEVLTPEERAEELLLMGLRV
ncbi:MAG: radical SAM family heme chaperone HemW, partial [Alphaproteobacteria bacterium]|nr:radical SAM family heme chaperone HemW [Alphaproteobacteria bacterium]